MQIYGNSSQELAKLSQDSGLIFFFKPDCSACRQQVKEFGCLKSSYLRVAMGFGAKKKELWREAQRLNLKGEFGKHIYQASQQALSRFKVREGLSPQTFLFKRGKVLKHFIGLTACDKLKKGLSLP